MNYLKIYFNNIENVLVKKIIKTETFLVIWRFDHDFFLWKNALRIYITQSFNENSCFLTETELRQLHKRFDHSFVLKLQHLLKRVNHDVKKSVLEKRTRFCHFCQKYAKSFERFKFILKNDVNFNFFIIVNIMYIENSLILHVIDETTRFQAVKWLQNINAKYTWDMLCLCWINVYLDSSNHIIYNTSKNFVSKKFRQFVTSITIITKIVLMKAH
jgi:hypothetical protein